MTSANSDPKLRSWLRWASEEGNGPSFIRNVAEAALIACRIMPCSSLCWCNSDGETRQ